MTKTKEKILRIAHQQLNTKGINQVSIRSIADEIGISAGNLAYHFKNIDVIIYELYMELVGHLSEKVQDIIAAETRMDWMLEQTEVTYRLLWDYRFLLLDFTTITRRIPAIKVHFQQLINLRKIQFKIIFDKWIKEGIIMEEKIPGVYDKFILSSIIFSDAWIPDAEVNFQKEPDEIIRFYAELFLNLIVPFLTEKGLAEYKAIMDKRPGISESDYPAG